VSHGPEDLARFAEGEAVGGFVAGLDAWRRPAEPIRLAMAGGWFDLAIGGKRDRFFSKPLPVSGTVLFVRPVRCALSGHLGDRLPIDMGDGSAVRIGDVTMLLVERTGSGSSPAMYRCVGLEPRDFKIIVVKSPTGSGPSSSRLRPGSC
jgi:microcystin degradation protein MlrC